MNDTRSGSRTLLLVHSHYGALPGLFELARARMPGATRLLMIGDQLETDIAGARAAGIDAALITGVSRWREDAEPAPRYVLTSLA